MTVAGARCAAFNQRVRGDGHWTGIAFAAVSPQVDTHQFLIAVDHEKGNAIRGIGTEIGMHVSAGADVGTDDGSGIGVDGRGGDIGIPEAAAVERQESTEAGVLTQRHLLTGGGRVARAASGPARATRAP